MLHRRPQPPPAAPPLTRPAARPRPVTYPPCGSLSTTRVLLAAGLEDEDLDFVLFRMMADDITVFDLVRNYARSKELAADFGFPRKTAERLLRAALREAQPVLGPTPAEPGVPVENVEAATRASGLARSLGLSPHRPSSASLLPSQRRTTSFEGTKVKPFKLMTSVSLHKKERLTTEEMELRRIKEHVWKASPAPATTYAADQEFPSPAKKAARASPQPMSVGGPRFREPVVYTNGVVQAHPLSPAKGYEVHKMVAVSPPVLASTQRAKEREKFKAHMDAVVAEREAEAASAEKRQREDEAEEHQTGLVRKRLEWDAKQAALQTDPGPMHLASEARSIKREEYNQKMREKRELEELELMREMEEEERQLDEEFAQWQAERRVVARDLPMTHFIPEVPDQVEIPLTEPREPELQTRERALSHPKWDSSPSPTRFVEPATRPFNSSPGKVLSAFEHSLRTTNKYEKPQHKPNSSKEKPPLLFTSHRKDTPTKRDKRKEAREKEVGKLEPGGRHRVVSMSAGAPPMDTFTSSLRASGPGGRPRR